MISLRNQRIAARHLVAVVLAGWFRDDTARFSSVAGFLGSMTEPDAMSRLRDYIEQHKPAIERALEFVTPSALREALGLANGTWPLLLLGDEESSEVTGSAKLWVALLETAADHAAVVALERAAAEAKDYRTADWARRRAATIEREDVLSWLSRSAVIPKYGFPVDVVELDTHNSQAEQSFGVSLDRDLSMAIAEYAPTSQVVANKQVWTSYGLKRVPAREWPRRYYRRSAADNLFVQWQKGQPEPSTPQAVDATRREYVVPAFGFTTARGPAQPLTSRPLRLFSTRPYLAEVLSPTPRLGYPAENPMVEVNRVSPGKMVVVCEGRRGEAFWICPECGAGFRELQRNHKTPFGRECKARLERLSLGHEFVTDVLQTHFLKAPPLVPELKWFAHALGAALLAGACEVLEIPEDELAYTVSYSLDHVIGIPPIVLYDDVPGGAGLVARLEDEQTLREVLSSACEKVRGQCGCGPDASCYGCLRTYRNQFAHRHMQRGPVYEYLSSILAEWPNGLAP